jgi:hypothetical protein
MYPYAAEGETRKRTLSLDEIQAMCDIYPKERPLPPCEQTIYGGCQTVRRGPAGGAGLLLVVISLYGYLRKLRTRSM